MKKRKKERKKGLKNTPKGKGAVSMPIVVTHSRATRNRYRLQRLISLSTPFLQRVSTITSQTFHAKHTIGPCEVKKLRMTRLSTPDALFSAFLPKMSEFPSVPSFNAP